MSQSRRVRGSALLKSALHWDLYASGPIAAGAIAVLAATNTEPPWEALAAGCALFGSLSFAAWRQLGRAEQRLLDERYGEIIRIIDPVGEKLRAPFVVTIYLSLLASASCIGAGLVTAVSDNFTLAMVSVAVPAWLGTWSLLALMSVISTERQHSAYAVAFLAKQEHVEYRVRRAGEEAASAS